MTESDGGPEPYEQSGWIDVMADRRIDVLIVDDSAVARMQLVHLLEVDPAIRVIGTVNDGQAAMDFLDGNRPGVVLMDISMPGLDGFEATRRIMETRPVPIIICSGTMAPGDIAATFRAMEAGAVACVEKPMGRNHADFERAAEALRQTVKLMSEVKVVRRLAGTYAASGPGTTARRWFQSMPLSVIGVGASTGGPMALQTILGGLPKDFPLPILVVQHIAPGFIGGLATWLNDTTSLQISIAVHGAQPLPGHVYLAPDDFHMGISVGGAVALGGTAPENVLRPAVSYLFRSLAAACGPAAVGVLLTGMGEDGATELKQMRDAGASTIAQDRASSIVHGMPGAAIALGGAMHVLPLREIAGALIALVDSRNGKAMVSL